MTLLRSLSTSWSRVTPATSYLGRPSSHVMGLYGPPGRRLAYGVHPHTRGLTPATLQPNTPPTKSDRPTIPGLDLSMGLGGGFAAANDFEVYLKDPPPKEPLRKRLVLRLEAIRDYNYREHLATAYRTARYETDYARGTKELLSMGWLILGFGALVLGARLVWLGYKGLRMGYSSYSWPTVSGYVMLVPDDPVPSTPTTLLGRLRPHLDDAIEGFLSLLSLAAPPLWVFRADLERPPPGPGILSPDRTEAVWDSPPLGALNSLQAAALWLGRATLALLGPRNRLIRPPSSEDRAGDLPLFPRADPTSSGPSDSNPSLPAIIDTPGRDLVNESTYRLVYEYWVKGTKYRNERVDWAWFAYPRGPARDLAQHLYGAQHQGLWPWQAQSPWTRSSDLDDDEIDGIGIQSAHNPISGPLQDLEALPLNRDPETDPHHGPGIDELALDSPQIVAYLSPGTDRVPGAWACPVPVFYAPDNPHLSCLIPGPNLSYGGTLVFGSVLLYLARVLLPRWTKYF